MKDVDDRTLRPMVMYSAAEQALIAANSTPKPGLPSSLIAGAPALAKATAKPPPSATMIPDQIARLSWPFSSVTSKTATQIGIVAISA